MHHNSATMPKMKNFVVSVSCYLGLFWTLAAGASIPRYFEPNSITRRSLTSHQVQSELGVQVSNTTIIFGPGDDRFDEATSRWTGFSKPDIKVVVEPGRESDVATIVRHHEHHPITLAPRQAC